MKKRVKSLAQTHREREEEIMAQLWGGRFTKETDKLVYNFNASISFDQKFYEEDIDGSIARLHNRRTVL